MAKSPSVLALVKAAEEFADTLRAQGWTKQQFADALAHDERGAVDEEHGIYVGHANDEHADRIIAAMAREVRP